VKKAMPSLQVINEGFGAAYPSGFGAAYPSGFGAAYPSGFGAAEKSIQMNQRERFLVKHDDQIYDTFYTEVYDMLNNTHRRSTDEIKDIIQTTQATTDESCFLDIGSGSGAVVNTLQQLGYDVYGVDKSEAMVSYSDKKYPDTTIKQGDVTDPMCYDKGIFTHILCLRFTLYHIEKKHTFFKNCYSWLKPGGYLVVHLVERDNFYRSVSAQSSIFGAPQLFFEETANDAVIDFDNFLYKHAYQIHAADNTAVSTETFTDKSTSNVRQQEQILYMEEIKDIVSMAAYYGFILQGKLDLPKKHQYLYIFERTM
jgi:2-polyprenyl-3-methyl-5-hydroxy-6-metoxy-1,4-benzoquinol methylase